MERGFYAGQKKKRVSWRPTPFAHFPVCAFDLGFLHLPQFTTWFKRHQGISPHGYRQRGTAYFVRAGQRNGGS
ncbi:hypothetical protein AW736_05920 [Termitidicoccus mucosus]|uniref:HTH araC/xylS-type domain-containing protein n=1 Tax=Termitidicoccus mucosus TaxID=1184151 RepID=A0A178IMC8_9BACT|nr:hypothetical protein AW736_05920 [Opitutaceae bacterium TSB47]